MKETIKDLKWFGVWMIKCLGGAMILIEWGSFNSQARIFWAYWAFFWATHVWVAVGFIDLIQHFRHYKEGE